MGKTKTVAISGLPDEKLSGEEKYKKKQKQKQEEEKKKKTQVTKVGLKGGERIKIVGGEAPEESKEKKGEKEVKKVSIPKKKKRGKNYQDAKKKIKKDTAYSTSDAIKLLKDISYSKFDGTVELHLVVKKKGFSTTIELPHSTGKTKKIKVADEKVIENLKKGKVDFDLLLATPQMMPKLVPYAKVLGPKGLMPNPKNNTIIKDKKDISKFSKNSLTLKTEKNAPLIHTIAGKLSQKQKELEENIDAIVKAAGKKQITKAYLKSTMSPSIKIKVS